jgi:hypothetical protein
VLSPTRMDARAHLGVGGRQPLQPKLVDLAAGFGRIVALYHRPSTLYHIY